jgi:hypothetical protein
MAMSVIDLNSGIQGVLEYMTDNREEYAYSVLTTICEVLCGGKEITLNDKDVDDFIKCSDKGILTPVDIAFLYNDESNEFLFVYINGDIMVYNMGFTMSSIAAGDVYDKVDAIISLCKFKERLQNMLIKHKKALE